MTDYKIVKAIRNGNEYELPGGSTLGGVRIFVVGGGGGGGGQANTSSANNVGGGGGGGAVCDKVLPLLNSGEYCVQVGNYGSYSCSSSIISSWGGGYSRFCGGDIDICAPGGCGGGSGCCKQYGGSGGNSGSGMTGGVPTLICIPNSCNMKDAIWTGGGGAGASRNSVDAYGGAGVISDISGSNQCYGFGGSGAACLGYFGVPGQGGGGMGWGCNYAGCTATSCGSGGGGSRIQPGNGAKGVVFVKYLTSDGYDMTGGCKYACGDYTIHCFTSNGTLCVN